MSHHHSDRPARGAQVAGVLVNLSWLDRLLPVWIVLAMATGLLLGSLVPGLPAVLGSVQVDHTSLPIAGIAVDDVSRAGQGPLWRTRPHAP